MHLATQRLGNTDMAITRVGFGAWAVGGGGWSYGWGPQNDAVSVAAIRHAVGRGINWIDTAAIYGLGHSEEVVGQALRAMPADERPYVFTKCGLIADPARPFDDPIRTLAPDSIRREAEASLRRLGVERIDLYQCHWPDAVGTPVEETWGAMVRLQEEGKVRAIGVSNFDVPPLTRAQVIAPVASLQPPFSLIQRDAGADVIPWAAAHDTGVIVYSPMQSGLLTDNFSAERVARLAPDDWRRRSSNFQPPALGRNLALRDALRPVAARHGVTISAVAVAWTLAWPGVTAAIVGARNAAQVDDWMLAASLLLTPQDLDEIGRAIANTGAGSGPVGPE